jgi:hypothetical protein
VDNYGEVGWLGLERQVAQNRLEKLVAGTDTGASDLLCLPADGDLEKVSFNSSE